MSKESQILQIDDISQVCCTNVIESNKFVYFDKVCNKQYASIIRFTKHMKECHGFQVLACRHCTAIFKDYSLLKLHINASHKIYKTPDEVVAKICSNKTLSKCPYCDYVTNNNTVLQNHINSHLGNKPFVCSVCSKDFSQKSNMKAHYRKHFEVSQFNEFSCDECFGTYSNLASYHNHLGSPLHTYLSLLNMAINQDIEHILLCKKCQYGCNSIQDIIEHAVASECFQNIYCNKCQMNLPFHPAKIRAHFQAHQDSMLVCFHCNKSFYEKRHNLMIHLGQCHPTEITYRLNCIYCEKIFDKKEELEIHYSLEHLDCRYKSTNLKEFGKIKCWENNNQCDFMTNSLFSLGRHIKLVHKKPLNSVLDTSIMQPHPDIDEISHLNVNIDNTSKPGRPRIYQVAPIQHNSQHTKQIILKPSRNVGRPKLPAGQHKQNTKVKTTEPKKRGKKSKLENFKTIIENLFDETPKKKLKINK